MFCEELRLRNTCAVSLADDAAFRRGNRRQVPAVGAALFVVEIGTVVDLLGEDGVDEPPAEVHDSARIEISAERARPRDAHAEKRCAARNDAARKGGKSDHGNEAQHPFDRSAPDMRGNDDLIPVHGRDRGRHLDIFAVEEYVPTFELRNIPIQCHAKADRFFHVVNERFKRVFDPDNLNHACPPPM